MQKADICRLAVLLGLTLLCATSYFWGSTKPALVPLYLDRENKQGLRFQPRVDIFCHRQENNAEACVGDCDDVRASVATCHKAVKRVYGQMSSACRSELYEVATSCSDTESNVCTTAQQTLEKCVAPFDKQLRSAARGF